MTFDQAQSPRLGQRTAIESTYVRMFSGTEIPEAAWPGQLIYRNETQTLQLFNGNAWEDVIGGTPGTLTFVGTAIPVSQHVGDIWFDAANGNQMYLSHSAGADFITTGEWELVSAEAPEITATTYIFRQDTPPGVADTPRPKDNDFWYETPGNHQYYYLSTAPGSHWISIRDTGIATAQQTADTAQQTAGAAVVTANTANSTANAANSTANAAASAVSGIVPVLPPSVSPSFTVQVLFKTLSVQTASVDEHTSLTYQVSLDAGFTQITLAVTAMQTYVQLQPLPAGVDLWVRVTAFNSIGSAPPSTPLGPFRTILIDNVDVSNTSLTMQKFRNSLHLIY